jgi:uncharacterized membrane protein
MLALTLVGIADAVYVAHGNITGAPLWCPILDGCNTVINSPYSRVFGVPMSYFGFIYYVFMFGLAARLAYDPFSNSLRFRAILYAALGAASSMYFMYLQIGFVREVCSYCLISAITSLILLLAALWHFQATGNSARCFRYWHLADIPTEPRDVRFWGKADMQIPLTLALQRVWAACRAESRPSGGVTPSADLASAAQVSV